MSQDSDTRPRRVDGLSGKVSKGRFGTGSKSEREVVWLELPDRKLVLRRKEGPAYDDAALERYVGKTIRCDGFIVGHSLLAERIEVVD